MGRLEKYKQRRRRRIGFLITFCIFISTLVGGLFVTDIMLNKMLGNGSTLKLVKIIQTGDKTYRVEIMGMRFKAKAP